MKPEYVKHGVFMSTDAKRKCEWMACTFGQSFSSIIDECVARRYKDCRGTDTPPVDADFPEGRVILRRRPKRDLKGS